MLERIVGNIDENKQVLLSSSLPLMTKCAFVWVEMKAVLMGQKKFTLPIGRGRVLFKYPDDFSVFREIFVGSIYKTNYKGKTVLDIGANKGYFSAYALLNGASSVLAFEPEQTNFEAVKFLFTYFPNRLTPYFNAISDHSGKIEFFLSDASYSHSAYHRSDKNFLRSVTVRAYSLGEAIRMATASSKNGNGLLAKIDIEGTERDVILNTDAQILKHISEIFIETHTFAGYDPKEIEDRLMSVGFALTHPREDIIHGRLS